jgi:uncharacterized protein (TIGR02453 family)
VLYLPIWQNNILKFINEDKSMSHFTAEYHNFFTSLEKNNNKEWFDSNRKIYETYVKEPFRYFVEEMIVRIHADNPDVLINASEAIFRINRDIRFSKDKTPYKTHMAAFISPGGRKAKEDPGIYFQLGVNGIRIYSGVHSLTNENLGKIRRTIAENPDQFSSIINDKKFISKFGEILGDKHKRIPPEFKEAVVKQPLLANKDFYVMANLTSRFITDSKLPDILMEYYYIAKPLLVFFTNALKS